jgi:AhpD family alkylhydroperoxidase
MASLTDAEKELVAIGAAIGAGCELCTQYHVRAALKSGLSREEIGRAIDEAQGVRREGGIAVSNVGRRMLGLGSEEAPWDGEPSDRALALVYIGSAAGCNAGDLLTRYISTAVERLGLSGEELREVLEMAGMVKEHAADFLRKEAERALGKLPVTAVGAASGSASCCASDCGA